MVSCSHMLMPLVTRAPNSHDDSSHHKKSFDAVCNYLLAAKELWKLLTAAASVS